MSHISQSQSNNTAQFDAKILEYIPHRPPMLLINKLVDVDEKSSCALVHISPSVSFFETGKGVPSWIGLEYMGQTAALIAGYQLEQGIITPHLGFLLGSRAYKAETDYFLDGQTLRVTCSEKVIVGDNLATFDCKIESMSDNTNKNNDLHTQLLASASLTVFRRKLETADADTKE